MGDCILVISRCVDGIYVAHMVKELGMWLLKVYPDNGYNHNMGLGCKWQS